MSGVLSTLQSMSGKLGSTFHNILDRLIPPEKRAHMLSKLQDFAINNPKLAVFLMTQIVLTGLPVLLFITFSITVFLFSLIAALLIGLLVAILFTLFMVGVALLVVLPTIFMTTFTASFLFLWGLGGYYTLKWFNEGDSPTPEGTSIGDKINNLTGGRMSWLTDGARKKQDDAHTDSDESPRLHSSDDDSSRVTGEKGSRRAPRKLAETSKNTSTESTDNKHKRVDKGTKGAASAASTTSNTAKTSDGAVGNDTGA